MARAPMGPTKPEAGVMAARPAIDPVAMPSMEGLPVSTQSWIIQRNAAVAAEICVTTAAMAAAPPAAAAEPALKPYQPTQSMPVPVTVMGRLWGVISFSLRGPTMMHARSAATPAVMCTTMPPAKSSTPMSPKYEPAPAHTAWHTGKYTTVDHRATKASMAENLKRSTKAPTMSPGVMIAKVIWNTNHSSSGIVPVTELTVTPLRKILSKPPTKEARLVVPSTMPTVEKAME
mmetsp:Transcript_72142/g.227646  ORF Transcript_72142/g.227646 Transcript_72142/m.227646 type:complete len:232 (+) Transcript_72142:388-1083(+)